MYYFLSISTSIILKLATGAASQTAKDTSSVFLLIFNNIHTPNLIYFIKNKQK